MHMRTNPKTHTKMHLWIKFWQGEGRSTICGYFVEKWFVRRCISETRDIFDFLSGVRENLQRWEKKYPCYIRKIHRLIFLPLCVFSHHRENTQIPVASEDAYLDAPFLYTPHKKLMRNSYSVKIWFGDASLYAQKVDSDMYLRNLPWFISL